MVRPVRNPSPKFANVQSVTSAGVKEKKSKKTLLAAASGAASALILAALLGGVPGTGFHGLLGADSAFVLPTTGDGASISSGFDSADEAVPADSSIFADGTSHTNIADLYDKATAVIWSEEGYTNVRSGPARDFDVIGTLHNGDQVTIYNIEGEWSRISDTEDYWVHNDQFEQYPVAKPATPEATASNPTNSTTAEADEPEPPTTGPLPRGLDTHLDD